MIAVSLEGRLGNQLFQYAFIYNASKILNSGFYIDKSIADYKLSQYFEVEADPFIFFDVRIFSVKGFKNIFSHHLKRKFYDSVKNFYHLEAVFIENNSVPSTQIENLKDGILYKGYFQSEDYFRANKEIITRLFKVKKKYRKEFIGVSRLLPESKKYVTIHIRRGDYLDLDYALQTGYYHNAIKRIHTDDNFYIFISDDIAFIKKEFNYIKNKYVSENCEIIDFQFLGFSDICILSNSSFSWWGAYLSSKKPKILAPGKWFGVNNDSPANVIPDSWIKLY